MGNIEVRHCERTCLNAQAYIKLIETYANLKNKIIICFDKRIKAFGQYAFDANKKAHIIRISPKENKKNTNFDENAQKFQLISTTLHELRHAMQKEDLGVTFWSKSYNYSKQISNPNFSEFYSQCEVDARIYESTNVLDAVDVYNNILQTIE